MSEGKFSQPRPHREEDRQIEESFRQLTEDRNRRRKQPYAGQEDIQKSVQNISVQEVSLPEDSAPLFRRNEQLDQTILLSPEQLEQAIPVMPEPPQPVQPVRRSPRTNEFDLLPEDPDSFFEEAAATQADAVPEISYRQEEPDFIDKLMQFGDFFRKHQTPVLLGLCGAAVLLIALFVSIFFTGGSKGNSRGTFEGDILIAGVNINGLTLEEAVDAVREVTDAAYPYRDMIVDFGTTQLELSPQDTGARLDAQAAVEAAFALEPAQEAQYIALLPYLQLNTDYIYGTLVSYAEDTGSTLTQTTYGLEGNEPALSADEFDENAPTQTLVITMGTPGIGFDAKDVYEQVLDAYSLLEFLVVVEHVETATEPDPIDLEAIYEEFYIAPVNASINMQTFETEAGSYGYAFDLELAKELVDNAQYGDVLEIPMEYIEPEILDNDSFFLDTLGEHQTRGTNDDDRNRNLRLACEALDGTVLNPGESLSFRTVLNKVANFREAPEDIGMEETAQGGVTQVSSTLYYAALLSDLSISSRSNHDYLPSFIDYGLDAGTDLKLNNSTGYPIRIDAEYTGGYVKVVILGTEERDYYVMLDSAISNTIAAETVYEEYEYDNDEGYEDGDVIEEGRTGYLVKSYRVKYDRKTGKELSRDFLASSKYPAVDRVVARVEDPPETEPPTEAPTEAPAEAPTEAPTEPPETTAPAQEPTEAPAAEIEQESEIAHEDA